jgi:hypothetical protein
MSEVLPNENIEPLGSDKDHEMVPEKFVNVTPDHKTWAKELLLNNDIEFSVSFIFDIPEIVSKDKFLLRPVGVYNHVTITAVSRKFTLDQFHNMREFIANENFVLYQVFFKIDSFIVRGALLNE